MNIKIIGFLAVVLVLIGLVYTGVVPFSLLGDGEYHTGISGDLVNNCETKHLKTGCTVVLGQQIGCWYGNVEQGYSEMITTPFNNRPVVTAMQTGVGAYSIDVNVYGTVTYVGAPNPLNYWTPSKGWYTVEYSTNGYTYQTIINTGDGTADNNIVGNFAGAMYKQSYARYDPAPIPGFPSAVVMYRIGPISFNIKNPHVGVLRVRQITEYTAVGASETKTTSEDYVFLVSGEGNVDIVDPQTRYIAGEDTVRFRVDVGYSGYTQGGTDIQRGWELKIYDNLGSLRKTWKIGDDKQGCRYDINGQVLDYAIPADAVSSGTSHTWRVVLTNTLFNQDDEAFFAITKDELAQAPDIKPITFGENNYEVGDYVEVNLEGIPNPSGRNTINGFLVNILYGTDGTDYVEDYHLKYVYASGTTATITFRASKGDMYVTVEAWAFDAPEASGGIMSEKATASVWIKEDLDPPVMELNWMGILICILVAVVIMAFAFYFMPSMPMKIIMSIIGAVLAAIIWFFFFAPL